MYAWNCRSVKKVIERFISPFEQSFHPSDSKSRSMAVLDFVDVWDTVNVDTVINSVL